MNEYGIRSGRWGSFPLGLALALLWISGSAQAASFDLTGGGAFPTDTQAPSLEATDMGLALTLTARTKIPNASASLEGGRDGVVYISEDGAGVRYRGWGSKSISGDGFKADEALKLSFDHEVSTESIVLTFSMFDIRRRPTHPHDDPWGLGHPHWGHGWGGGWGHGWGHDDDHGDDRDDDEDRHGKNHRHRRGCGHHFGLCKGDRPFIYVDMEESPSLTDEIILASIKPTDEKGVFVLDFADLDLGALGLPDTLSMLTIAAFKGAFKLAHVEAERAVANEPASLVLLGLALGATAAFGRRRPS